MSVGPSQTETEIKLRAPSAAAGAELLTTNGFSVSKPRVCERNALFDTPSGDLRATGRLLRLREAGNASKLTFKGVARAAKHKSREELELDISSARTFEQILNRLGYQRTFVYEKYRTEFTDTSEGGTATLDETPIGTFLELEGEATWIDATAERLGFVEADYITSSYGRLYAEWCASRDLTPADMVWQDRTDPAQRPPDQ